MSDLFGAPSGIIASDTNIRQNILSGLSAAHTLGQIGMQPIQAQELSARARLYGAEAAKQEQAAAAQKALLDLQGDFAKSQAEAQARGNAIEQGKANGVNLTAADVPPGGFANQSQATQLEPFANFARGRGYPPMLLAPIDKEIADIHEKEAIARYRDAQATEVTAKAHIAKMTQVGNIAGAAAQSPQAYMAIRGDKDMSALLPPGLSGDFNSDRRVLLAVQAASQDSIKRANLEREMKDDASKAALRGSDMAKNKAAITNLDARTNLAKTRADAIKKNDGETSPSAVKARESLAAHRAATDAAKLRAEFPPVPLDPTQRHFDKTYTAADGVTRFVWQKDPVTGKGVARRLNITPAAAKAQAAKPAADEAETADEPDEAVED